MFPNFLCPVGGFGGNLTLDMEATDAELLEEFARHRNEEAFRQLVRRHLAMVFATARRILGDSHQAEEIAQTVFLLLADKVGTIGSDQHLAGWLYRAASHHAMHRRRSEGRRQQREQIAMAMQLPEPDAPANEDLLGELEDALAELQSDERDALVLRFLEDRQLREVGHELGVSEEAARKRVSRALDRLREIFGQRGITASTGVLTALLVGQAGMGVPTSLGATITTAVVGGTAAVTATALTQGATSTMNLLNLKTAAAILVAATVTGTSTYVAKQRQVHRLETANQRLEDKRAKLVDSQHAATAAIQLRDEQIEELRKTTADVPRLRGEVDKLNRELGKVDKLETENRQLHETINSFRPEEFADFERFMRIARLRGADHDQMLKMPYLKLLGDSLELAANKNDGAFPKSLDAAKPYMGEKFYGGIQVMGRRVRADDFEICFQGDLKSIKDPGATKVLQETVRMSLEQNQRTGGVRAYRGVYFADGHIEFITEQHGPDGWKVVKAPNPAEGFE